MSRRYAFRHGWRWLAWYLRNRRLAAAARQAWTAYVVGDDGETCQECGRTYLLWHATDDLYGRVTGRWPKPWGDGSGRSEAASGLFCLACFDRMAAKRGISIIWQPQTYPGTSRRAEPGQPT